ncbi:MAG: hypothetical protein JO189_18245 [Deltaproteobacteria bacterium]|nr:hypothetical protein [Deltaproteobacteria bacterium]
MRSDLEQFGRSEMETAAQREKMIVARKNAIMFSVFAVLSIMPIVYYTHLPLADYPNHLARLLIHKSASDPYLSKFFAFHWVLAPNLGFDLFTQPFISHVSVELAGKIAIITSFLIIYAGTIMLDRQLNQDRWGLSLFAPIFLYNGPFRFGFISYTIGVGFAIWGFWFWVRYREKAYGIWIVIFIFVGVAVFFMHLEAFGIYAVCVASYEGALLWEQIKIERQLRRSLFNVPISGAASLVLPCVLLWFSAAPISHGGFWQGYAQYWITFTRKIEALAAPLFYSNPAFEIPLLLVISGLFFWALATRTIVANSRMLIAMGVFGVILIVMPFGFGELMYIDYRLPSGVAFIALASFAWGKASPARHEILGTLLGICLIIRVGSVLLEWQPAQAVIKEYYTALRLVPPGSRLLVYMPRMQFGDRYPPLRHVPALAAAMQGVFDPHTFTNGSAPNGPQLLNLKPNYRDYWIYDPSDPQIINSMYKFDYLLQIKGPPVEPLAGLTLKEISLGQTFVLYRIDREPHSMGN